MKKFLLSVLALGAILGTSAVRANEILSDAFISMPPSSKQEASSTTSDASAFYDGWDTADSILNGIDQAVGIGTGAIEPALVQVICDTLEGKSGTVLEKVLTWLGEHGVQYGAVKKIADSKILKFAPYVIDGVTATVEGVHAWQAGDKEAFQKAVTDFIINTTANLVGELAKWGAEALIASGTLGVGALPGYFIATGAGIAASEGTKLLLNKFARENIENFVGQMWDDKHGKDGDGDNDGGNGKRPSDGNVSPGDLEGLDGDRGDGNGGNKGPNGGGKKPTYQKPQGIKAHQWGTK